jgi:hypothetical protein
VVKKGFDSTSDLDPNKFNKLVGLVYFISLFYLFVDLLSSVLSPVRDILSLQVLSLAGRTIALPKEKKTWESQAGRSDPRLEERSTEHQITYGGPNNHLGRSHTSSLLQ